MKAHKATLLLALSIFVLSTSVPVLAQQKGDRVVVTADVDTKISNRVIERVFGGEIDTITGTQGKWCALTRSKGWLPTQYVMNLDMAEKFYTKRIEKNKMDFDALATRGMIRFEREEYEKAIADLNESIRIRPGLPVTFNNRGIVLKAMGRYPEALINLDQAIKLKADYSEAHENRGLVLVAMGKFDLAIKNFDKAISYRKDNPWSFINRGKAKSDTGNYQGAKKDFLTALKMNKNISDAYIGLSIVYLAENELDKAIKFANTAIKKNPKNGLAYNQRGWTQYNLGKMEEALFDLDKAIRYAPKLPIVFNNRGVCHSDMGNHKKALRDLNRAIALNPNSAVTLTNRGRTHMDLKNFSKATADLKKAIKLGPKFADAAHTYSWLLATCPSEEYRDGKAAVEHGERACEISKWKNWSYIDTLAAAHAESGNFEKAIELAKKAIEIAPDEKIEDCKSRLTMFESKKPYRSEFGKSGQKRG